VLISFALQGQPVLMEHAKQYTQTVKSRMIVRTLNIVYKINVLINVSAYDVNKVLLVRKASVLTFVVK